jgi:hypothetical protein
LRDEQLQGESVMNRRRLPVLAALLLAILAAPVLAAGEEDGYIYDGDDYLGEIDADDVGDLARAVQRAVGGTDHNLLQLGECSKLWSVPIYSCTIYSH